ncbi:MAG TPA: Spx/MgsR family RNA polymerase-binding regulatory protein [Oligoflexia bacterium]|nr:Spx/MgsR family RNA polymerase-binding regulatory protein [Oligoflexia bacterium]
MKAPKKALLVYQYPKCSTCKNALKYLEKKKRAAEIRHIVETPPTRAELKKMLEHLDGNLRKMFNTSGLLYKELGLAKKLEKLSENEALDLLSKHGMLVKRPFVLSENRGWVGFKEKDWDQILALSPS